MNWVAKGDPVRMRIRFQNSWVKVVIELFPSMPPLQRYRIAPAHVVIATQRRIRRRIAQVDRNPRLE